MRSPSAAWFAENPDSAAVPAGRTIRPARWCVALALTTAATAGCSSGGGSPSLSAPTTGTAPTTAAQPTATTAADVRQQVLHQYDAFWAELTPASEAPAPRRRALLMQFATDPELASLLHGMAKGDRHGTVFYGRDVPRPRIKQLSVTQGLAVIDDCQDSSHAGNKDSASGRRLTVGVARHLVTATMHLIDGTWRIALVTYEKGHC